MSLGKRYPYGKSGEIEPGEDFYREVNLKESVSAPPAAPVI